MAKTIDVGMVLQGDYIGNRIKMPTDSLPDKLMIVGNNPNDYTQYKTIDKYSVERYETVSANNVQKPADTKSVANGVFWLGALGGLLASQMNSTTTTEYDIAVFFKDGKKSLIRLNSSDAYQHFTRILFTF